MNKAPTSAPLHSDISSRPKFTIVRFRDGDTVEGFLQCPTCNSAAYETIRILDLESWEPYGPSHGIAMEVAKRLTTLLRGRRTVLTTSGAQRDRYGRILSDLAFDSTTLSQVICTEGLGWRGVGEPPPPNLVPPVIR